LNYFLEKKYGKNYLNTGYFACAKKRLEGLEGLEGQEGQEGGSGAISGASPPLSR